MGVVSWIFLGLLAGALAKLLMPGRDGGGWIVTCLLGVAGAFVGGYLASLAGIAGASADGVNLASIATATAGAFVLLALYRMIR